VESPQAVQQTPAQGCPAAGEKEHHESEPAFHASHKGTQECQEDPTSAAQPSAHIPTRVSGQHWTPPEWTQSRPSRCPLEGGGVQDLEEGEEQEGTRSMERTPSQFINRTSEVNDERHQECGGAEHAH
jgi:hypothetical protein